jgi:ureidoacrylate peracid hydrolase
VNLADKVRPEHTALLLIDLQRNFFCKGGIIEFMGGDAEALQSILPGLEVFLSMARKHLKIIIFTKDTFYPYLTSPAALEHYERAGMLGDLDPRVEEFFGIEPQEGDIVLPKHMYSAFIGTPLDSILRSNGITTVIVTGVATNVCVESTARQAFMHDYYVVVPADLVAGADENAKRMALANIGTYFGEVVTSDRILAAWAGP